MNDNNFAGNSKSAIDFLGNEWKYDCMGCAIARGDIKIPGGVIYDGEFSVLGADPEIPIPGFLIISLKRHSNSFSELSKAERNEIGNIIYTAEKAMRELNIATEVTLVQEERSKHFHIWIFPNHSWMTEKFGKGITYLRDISSYAQKNANKEDIKEILDCIEKIREYFEQHNIGE